MTLWERIAGGLIVSCQPLPDERLDPMRDSYVTARVAAAAEMGGAVAVRINGPDDVRAVRASVHVPVIGLWKDGASGVVITPTAEHAADIAVAGADVVAVDATFRERPDGRTFADTVRIVHDRTGGLVLADVATYDEGVAALEAGADAVATTLSGYSHPITTTEGPDLELVQRLADEHPVPVLAEGRYRTADHIRAAFAAGAHAVVMGNAVTSPLWITRQLTRATPRTDQPNSQKEST